jgi:hypothetical protein
MIGRRTRATVIWVGVMGFSALWCLGTAVAAEGNTKEPPGLASQIGTALKNAGTKIEQGVTSVVKQLEESETPKKIGNELKRLANALGEKVEQAGKKLKESFKTE